ncbi:MAG: hypothetical protein CSA75_01405 [Sorangium cellulosum]|nr:MAG: hypothetical protein CSA75_01405 [Sorangium cellulosum]
MRRALTLAAVRALVLLILTTSSALLYDSVGLFAYLCIFGVTLMRHEFRRKYLTPIATLGGVFGVSLLIIQAVWIGSFCSLCVVVDIASVTVALLAWIHRNSKGHDGRVPRFV